MTLFKKTIFSLNAIGLGLGLALTNLTYANTSSVMPIYNPNANLSLWVGADHGMEGASETAYLYSDGAACYALGAVGAFVLLKGKWQYNQDKTSIDIQMKTKSDNDFLLVYNSADDGTQDERDTKANQLSISEFSFYNKEPIYLGFSTQETPAQMTMFDYSRHQDSITIPPDSQYLFVAKNITSGKSNKVARFDLNGLGHDKYNIELFNNDGLMGVSESSINHNFSNNPLKIVIKKDKIGFKYGNSNHIKFFDKVNKFNVNITHDGINLKRLHGYCSGRSDDFYLDIAQNTQSNLTKPTYINWRGNISPNADWLKTQD